jgi:hypothetical protein
VATARGLGYLVREPRLPRWFRGLTLDLRSLALFRVAIAGCLLADLLLRIPQLDDFYTDRGVLPRAALFRLKDPLICLHCLAGEWWVEFALLMFAIICALGLLVGYRTRLSTILSWALLTSMHARNPFVEHSGGVILQLMLFWGMFLPLAGRGSVDGAADSDTRPTSYFAPAGVALIFQICAIYWFAFAEKMDPIWLTERSAVYYTLRLDMLATPFGTSLLGYPALLRALALGTLMLELVGPLLAISPVFTTPLRFVAVVGFIGFHAALALTTRLGTFPWICAAAWLVLLPSAFWNAVRVEHTPVVGRWATRLDRHRLMKLPGKVSAAVATAALFVIAVTLAFPRLRVDDQNVTETSALQRLLSLVVLQQRWTMFAPHPMTGDGWYVMEGMRRDRTRVDVWSGGRATGAKPANFADLYRDTRWLGYLHRMRDGASAPYWPYFSEYLCRGWNERHRAPVDSVTIYFMLERTPPPGVAPVTPQKKLLLRHACGDSSEPGS